MECVMEKDEVDEDEALMRKIIFPEEDRHLFTTTPWRGEYRWFRSPNIVPLERWRRSDRRCHLLASNPS